MLNAQLGSCENQVLGFTRPGIEPQHTIRVTYAVLLIVFSSITAKTTYSNHKDKNEEIQSFAAGQ